MGCVIHLNLLSFQALHVFQGELDYGSDKKSRQSQKMGEGTSPRLQGTWVVLKF